MGRATATVLFTDLVGSTERRVRVGEETAEELRRTHDRVLTEAVETNSGRVVKGLGDGIMATFAGASDAVAAAVSIQQAVDRLNRCGKPAVPLGVRVGLSAGDVTVEENDVHGTPVIEAARLCGVAAGGEILASEMVRWLARGSAAAFIAVGDLELKGLPEAVPAVRVEWEPVATSAIPMPNLLTDVGRIFVGRDAELDRLGQLWKEATAGERRVAFLAGEPGVGKTRLAAELAARAHDGGATVLAGRCDEDLGVPYQPFVEALRHFVDHTTREDLPGRLGRYGGELVRPMPELAERLPDLPPPLQSDPETERYRLFDAVAAWLGAASADEPVLLVLDDLQWAAKPTLLLLRHVVRSAQPVRLLVLGTYRDTELGHDHPLVEVVADLRGRGLVERISLRGLDATGVFVFMEEAAGHPLDDDDLAVAQAVHEETEGNPFFVREVLRHLTETGALQRRQGRWGIRLPVEELGIPESVRDVVGRRLGRLSDAANQALRTAAVIGPEFDVAVVQTAGGFDHDAVLCALEEATEARLVIETTARRYRFAHALVRDSLYGELSAARRVAVHHKVAEAIESLHAESLDDHLPALAHHWARASAPATQTARAVDYAKRAGDRALVQLAHDEAAAYYRQALDLLDPLGEPVESTLRADLLIALGEAQRRAGDGAYRQTLLDAARLAQQHGDADRLACAALANSRAVLMSAAGNVDVERIDVLEAALDRQPAADSQTRARLLAHLAMELTYTRDRDRRVKLSDEALAMARRLGDPATLSQVLAGRFYAITAPDTLHERLANTAELLALAGQLEDPLGKGRALALRCRVTLEAGQIDETDRILDAYRQLAGELGQPTLDWVAAWMRAGRLLLAGDVEASEALARQALEIAQDTGQPDASSFFAVQLFWIRYDQGRLDDMESLLLEVLDAHPALSSWRPMLAVLYCETGRNDEASRLLASLAAAEFDFPVDLVWALSVALCAITSAHLSDATSAAALYPMIAPYAGQWCFPAGGMASGTIDHYLGLLATTRGHFDEAETHFANAAAIHDQVAAPCWRARTRLEWARMLLARRRPGDADRARELLGQALATARELGLANVERRAVALLQEYA